MPGVSMLIEPKLYLQMLQDLLPDRRHVIVFFNPNDKSWIPFVEYAAKKLEMTMEAVGFTDSEETHRQIVSILETIDPRTTAVWFAKNTISLDKGANPIFSEVIERAWERDIAVFSSDVELVKQGFLFTLLPNFQGIGTELGMRIQQGAAARNTGLSFARSVRLAVNIRVVSHLGINPFQNLIENAIVLNNLEP